MQCIIIYIFRKDVKDIIMKKKTFFKKIISICLTLAIILSCIYYYPAESKAASSYYIKINRATNVVTVYKTEDNTPFTAFTCSTGGNNTPLGTFTTSDTYVWHTLVGPTYGQYCVRITGGILFHSVWYYNNKNKASMSNEEFNKLGTAASHGCIRLQLKDSKWIYDNCGSGTKVTIFDGTAADDPLGKPAVIKVQTTSKMGWDPTDPDPANPYAPLKPTITVSGVKKVLNAGDVWEPLNGITAKDSLGGDATGYIKYYGNVDTSKAGKYKVIYQVTDLLGRSRSYAVTYKVKDDRKAILSGVHGKQNKDINYKYNVREGITASTPSGTNITSSIIIEVQSPSDTSPVRFRATTLRLKEAGTYTITYSVVNPDNNKVTKRKTIIKVKDNRKATINGVSSKVTREYNSKYDTRAGITATSSSGKNITFKVKLEVQSPDSEYPVHFKGRNLKLTETGTYYLIYTVANPSNNKECKKVLKLTCKDTKAPVIKGTSNEKIITAYGEKADFTNGISANLRSGKDVSDRIKISIMTPVSGKYVEISTEDAKNYPLSILGTYKVKYTCDNPYSGSTTERKRAYKSEDMKKPVLNVCARQKVKTDTSVNLLNGISAKYALKGTSLDKYINVAILAPGTDEYVEIDSTSAKAYIFESDGTYKVKYSVTNPNNGDATTAKAVLFIVTK